MKKSLLFLLAALFSIAACAQHNFISVDPVLPLFGTAEAHYERAVLSRGSLVMGIGNKFNSGILEISGFNTNQLQTNDLSFHGIRLLPEARYYLSHDDQGLTGFYIGLYYKYQTNKSEISGFYSPDSGGAAYVALDLSVRTHGFGAEIGYKLFVYRKLCLDFIISGLGLAYSSMYIEERTDVSEECFSELSKEIKQAFLLKGITPDLLVTQQSLKSNFTLPSLRYGLKIGIGF
jgi:hypothetical protein